MTETDHYSLVVGRFQTTDLHAGHKAMLTEAACIGQPLVAIGVSPITPSAAQPLSYTARAKMVKAARLNAITFPVNDHVSDIQWANNFRDKLFALIAPSFVQENAVKLHFIVGKDNAFDHMLDNGPMNGFDYISEGLQLLCEHAGYEFSYDRVTVDEVDTFSATELRESVVTDGPLTSGFGFNEGVIWATQKRFPTAYMCVDIAAVDTYHGEILLIQKYENGPWMLPGGFTEPSTVADDPIRTDAARELYEETGVNVLSDSLEFLGHFRIDDWRYRKEADKINTALYKVERSSDVLYNATAGDDAYNVGVFHYHACPDLNSTSISDIQVAESHKPLITAATGYKFK